MGIYSERAYFNGDHCQHVADRDEMMRLRHIRLSTFRIMKAVERRKGSRRP